jgi:hypothetical protein
MCEGLTPPRTGMHFDPWLPPRVCVQETKLRILDDFLVIQLLGAGFDYNFLPAMGRRGGILIACTLPGA